MSTQPATFWLAILSAVLMIVGGLGPWATALGIISVSGTRGDGWIVVAAGVLGLAALTLSVMNGSPWMGVAAVVFGGAGAVTSAYDLSKLRGTGAVNFFGRQLQVVTPGWGIYLAVGASVALAAFVGALLYEARPAPARRAREAFLAVG